MVIRTHLPLAENSSIGGASIFVRDKMSVVIIRDRITASSKSTVDTLAEINDVEKTILTNTRFEIHTNRRHFNFKH